MKTLTTPPRLAREGFIAASAPKGWRRSDMLVPKSETVAPFPVTPRQLEGALAYAIGRLAPDEVRVLSWIVEHADIIEVEGANTAFLLVAATPELLDTLAAFDTEAEDLELVCEDEDDDPGGCEHDGREPCDDDEIDYRPAPRRVHA